MIKFIYQLVELLSPETGIPLPVYWIDWPSAKSLRLRRHTSRSFRSLPALASSRAPSLKQQQVPVTADPLSDPQEAAPLKRSFNSAVRSLGLSLCPRPSVCKLTTQIRRGLMPFIASEPVQTGSKTDRNRYFKNRYE